MTEEYDATLWEKVEDDLHRAVFLKQATVPQMPFAQALSLTVSKCLTDKRKILVIDTLAAWVGFEDENDASKVTPALNLIRAQIANTGIACILVHHSKKGGGDHGEAIRGSSALLASVDISIEFAYAGHDRRISILSRFGGDYPDLIVARDGGALVLRGTAEQVRDEEDERRIALLPEAPGITRAEIEKLWGASQRVTEKYLGRYQAWQRVGKNMPPSGRGTTYFRLPMPHLKESGDD